MQLVSMRFDRFSLDPSNRLLLCDGVPVELSGRYLDALTLLTAEAGRLVSKDRFLDEVWNGVPVTDEALTQCIKSLRRALGDDAARPRFIETVPKHGYRFVAAVEIIDGAGLAARPASASAPAPVAATQHQTALPGFDWRRYLLLSGAGIVGGGIAGLIGGIFYGFVGAAQPLQPGMGAGSIVLVLASLTVLIALIGAAGVSLGIAAALLRGGGLQWHVAGGACGGLVVGGVVKLLGLDAFNLLFGQSPGNITGALEGAALGGAVGLGIWLCGRKGSLQLWPAALCGALAGAAITALGGKLLGGSLDVLAAMFPQSRLRLDPIGSMLGEEGFGPVSAIITGGFEGMLFAACVTGAMLLALRQTAGEEGSQSRPR